jgi:hypothetical protein
MQRYKKNNNNFFFFGRQGRDKPQFDFFLQNKEGASFPYRSQKVGKTF